MEEFYRPMLVAGLLTSDQLAAIFLNADELIQVNAHFSEVNYLKKKYILYIFEIIYETNIYFKVLREAIEQTYDSGDEDLTLVNIGKLFLESLSMLRAFESYCTRQVITSIFYSNLKIAFPREK